MATDSELTEVERRHKLEMRQYRMYRWFTYALYLAVFAVTVLLLDSRLPESNWGGALAIGALVALSMFLAEWISALVFKRKSRPWRSRLPEDENPRTR